MATRSGKANPVQSGIGAASPRNVRYRSAGLASVWDWGDDADGDVPGMPIACDIDCAVCVTARVSDAVDLVLAVTGACATAMDMGIVTVRLVDIVCDQRLFVYRVSTFAIDSDIQAVMLKTRDALSDEQVIVSNALIRGFDVAGKITGAFSEQLDVALRCCAMMTTCCDVLVSVPEPRLLTADTLVGVSGAVSNRLDQRLVVLNTIERVADSIQGVWCAIRPEIDALLVVGQTIRLDADATLRIDSISVVPCDMEMVVSCLLALETDLEVRMIGRLAEADSIQRIFGLLIEESHVIQV